METAKVNVVRYPQRFESDDSRVITRQLVFGPNRIRSILARIARMNAAEVQQALEDARQRFAPRHRNLEQAFLDNYHAVRRRLPRGTGLSQQHKLLAGAYFTLEYSIESAALFNPSIVPHPDQSGLDDGAIRVLISFRATGEGHLSSIVFRRCVIDPTGRLTFDPPPRFAHTARPHARRQPDKDLFRNQMLDLGVPADVADRVLAALPRPFSLEDLRQALRATRRELGNPRGFSSTAADIRWLAIANYEIDFPLDCLPAEIVIFPATRSERMGMEDLRLVHFVNGDGQEHYYGTYTAYDGRRIKPMLLETTDFHHFQVRALSGRLAHDKGMAMFPRQVDGQYLMVSRHDGECLYLLRSDSPYVWEQGDLLQAPQEPWEMVQVGNCGSPIETEAGWILLTHGVGPVRRYCIGALLLDRDNPAKVLGRLRKPLLAPLEEEREGYVPNVLYSCGALKHHGELIIPYAMSDAATSFARVNIRELIDALLEDGP